MSYPIFDRFGIELEYMIVDRDTLSIRPLCDALLAAVSESGEPESEVKLGPISWSNELSLHVVEFKTTAPSPSLSPLVDLFQEHIHRANDVLAPMNARLMPTAMHPWMNPDDETVLWPHGHGAIYQAFDRVFGCRGHGWSNLQSMHINLPFQGDDEFARLHAAIRLVLPILPALAASSPIVEGRPTGLLDNRLEFYRQNGRRVPEVTGRVVPESVGSHADYDRVILAPMYDAIAPLDPEGILRHEWLNARGAIARFQRETIEIRLLDVQECPRADLAIAALVIATVRALAEGRWSDLDAQRSMPLDDLEALLLACLRDADHAPVTSASYLRHFGLCSDALASITAGALWRHLHDTLRRDNPGLADSRWTDPLTLILDHGPLARRILSRLGPEPSQSAIHTIYKKLSLCLNDMRLFSSGTPSP